MPPVSHAPSRSSSRLKRKRAVDAGLPFSLPIGVGSSRPTVKQEWTWEEKLAYFRTLPRILCPASPPPTFGPDETVKQARRRSRQRIERMTKRLADRPLFQARHLLHLASAELKGPFSPGCKYWGTEARGPGKLTPEDLAPLGLPIKMPTPYKPPRGIGALQIDIGEPPRFSTPSAPGPSSTIITGPPTPFTPPSATRAPIDLVRHKTSVGRELASIDFDPSSPIRSPTPTPSLPPSRMGSQAISGSRPPETPGSASQRSFILNLQQASRASSTRSRRVRPRTSRGLRILPSVGPPAVGRAMDHDRAESRDQSPLLRFSQRGANAANTGLNLASQSPESSKQKMSAPVFQQETIPPISQQETPETYTYNSEFSVERHIEEIGRFMEEDIRN
ncbi:unnamed protein product [Rhizoctonia solani]|uniref:Uncharacterized protein n=1 Tax=Rhizoctonia solani TaxID=456999 RepID=A0A8H3DU08_9AGAM|nr:unnamed protein product [Rhizoctonia solani]